MILKLHGSRLFKVDTAIRFSQKFKVSMEVWHEIWKRHLSGYDNEALAGYFIYKTGKPISARTIRQWLIKTEVYCRANHVMLMGVRAVSSEYFGVHEAFVLNEVLRNMRNRGTQESRTIV